MTADRNTLFALLACLTCSGTPLEPLALLAAAAHLALTEFRR